MPEHRSMHHEDYTVGWICALPTETAAAIAMLDEHHEELPRKAYDDNTYSFGRIGKHNVVIACLPAGVTGTTPAANVASQLRISFPAIKIGLLVGIGSGVPSDEHDIRLGDVVISKPTGMFGGVIQYDFGKTVQENKFIRTGQLNRPPDVLLKAVAKLEAKHLLHDHELENYLCEAIEKYPKRKSDWLYQGTQHDLLFRARYDHNSSDTDCKNCDIKELESRDNRDQNTPVIHYGLLASANQVMQYGQTRDKLGKELGVICFETEAAGLMDNFPCLVIRGICDYADSHKNNAWQSYASAVAAAYGKELLYTIPAEAVMQTAKAAEDQGSTYKQVLAGYEKALGPDHTSTLVTVDNLGVLYYNQRKLDEAEAMYKRALAGIEKVLGPDHTLTLDTVNNLGILYRNQGKLAEAEAMHQRAQCGRER